MPTRTSKRAARRFAHSSAPLPGLHPGGVAIAAAAALVNGRPAARLRAPRAHRRADRRSGSSSSTARASSSGLAEFGDPLLLRHPSGGLGRCRCVCSCLVLPALDYRRLRQRRRADHGRSRSSLLVAVLVIGVEGGGARRWIGVGELTHPAGRIRQALRHHLPRCLARLEGRRASAASNTGLVPFVLIIGLVSVAHHAPAEPRHDAHHPLHHRHDVLGCGRIDRPDARARRHAASSRWPSSRRPPAIAPTASPPSSAPKTTPGQRLPDAAVAHRDRQRRHRRARARRQPREVLLHPREPHRRRLRHRRRRTRPHRDASRSSSSSCCSWSAASRSRGAPATNSASSSPRDHHLDHGPGAAQHRRHHPRNPAHRRAAAVPQLRRQRARRGRCWRWASSSASPATATTAAATCDRHPRSAGRRRPPGEARMRLALTGGGTGGHIFPALAVLRGAPAAHGPASTCVSSAPRTAASARLVEARGLRFVERARCGPFAGADRSRLARSALERPQRHRHRRRVRPRIPAGCRLQHRRLRQLPRERRRAAPPPSRWSSTCRMSRPGWAVRVERLLATRMTTTTDAALAFLPAKKTVVTGYPVRETFFKLSRAEARAALGLPGGRHRGPRRGRLAGRARDQRGRLRRAARSSPAC